MLQYWLKENIAHSKKNLWRYISLSDEILNKQENSIFFFEMHEHFIIYISYTHTWRKDFVESSIYWWIFARYSISNISSGRWLMVIITIPHVKNDKSLYIFMTTMAACTGWERKPICYWCWYDRHEMYMLRNVYLVYLYLEILLSDLIIRKTPSSFLTSAHDLMLHSLIELGDIFTVNIKINS